VAGISGWHLNSILSIWDLFGRVLFHFRWSGFLHCSFGHFDVLDCFSFKKTNPT
jgi:hypothetical protein